MDILFSILFGMIHNMDILFVIILILLGTRIFSKKNRGNRQNDSGDTGYEADHQPGNGADGNGQQQTGANMTWEDMERKYGIKIEHDKPTMAESSGQQAGQKRSVTITLGNPNSGKTITIEKSGSEKTIIIDTKEGTRQTWPDSAPEPQPTPQPAPVPTPEPTWQPEPAPTASRPTQPTWAERMAQYEAKRAATVAAFTPMEDTLQVTTSRRRKPRLPAGGLKAGIMWSLILEPPKAKQRRAGGKL